MKRTTAFQNGLIWFGAGVSLAEILTGTYFAPSAWAAASRPSCSATSSAACSSSSPA